MPVNDRTPLPVTIDPDRPGMTETTAPEEPGATTTTAPNEPSTVPAPSFVTGERYELLDEIARGGMGVVYRARDLTLGREVAVKVLQDRFGPESAVARRFHDEARIAAQLQHPGIPPVHDLGVLPDGRSFLAMKLIKGRTLDELLESRADPSAERGRFLAAFEQLGQALAYAHAHQVIHRDLKPANVMVGSFGEVQVMDWGLAKVLAGPEPQSTDPQPTSEVAEVRSPRESDGSFTEAGSVMGTPAFMPPEQARGEAEQVDRRSDVFGLGAILTVVLTGKPPYRATGGNAVRIKAAQADLADCFARLDACGAEPELVALCKRCLAPRQADRPVDAGEVAQAVGRFRAAAEERARRAELDRVKAEGELSLAEARGAERRKRRRVWIGSGVALALVVTGGLGAILLVQREANNELAQKNRDLADEQAKVVAKNTALEAEQIKVEQRFDMARKAISAFHTTLEAQKELEGEAFKPLRGKLLGTAAGFYRELEALLAGESDPKSRLALADGAYQLATLTEKIGDQREAVGVYRQALSLRRELAAEPGAKPETRLMVSVVLRRLGAVLAATGKQPDAMRSYEDARDAAAALAAESPSPDILHALAQAHTSMAIEFVSLGKSTESLAAFHQARSILEKLVEAKPDVTQFQSDLARSYNGIASVLNSTGKRSEAMDFHRRALGLRQKIADANPAVAPYRSDLAASHFNIGLLLKLGDQYGDALASLAQARAVHQKLVEDYPAVTQYQSDLARSYNAIGAVRSDNKKPREALEAYERARDLLRKLVEANPAGIQFRSSLAGIHYNIGLELRAIGRRVEALAAYEQARLLQRKLADANPTVANFPSELALNLHHSGVLLGEIGLPGEALVAHEQALALRQKLADASPTVARFQSDVAASHDKIAVLLNETGRSSEALTAHQQARALRQKIADAAPAVAQFQIDLAVSHNNLGVLFSETGEPGEAIASFERARDIQRKVVEANPAVARFRTDLARTHNNIGRLLGKEGRYPEAIAAIEEGLKHRQTLADANPLQTDYSVDLGWCYAYRGWVRFRAGQAREAAEDLRQVVRRWAEQSESSPGSRFENARVWAILARLGAEPTSGVTAEEAAIFADQAVASLADAMAGGWARNRAELQEPDFDALRDRADFLRLAAMPELLPRPKER